MISEVSIAGVYVPPFLLYLIFAWPIFLGIRTVLARTGVLRFAWHPALFEFSILLVIIALLILYC